MPLTIKSAELSDEARIVEIWRACNLVASYNDPGADFRFAKTGICSDVLMGLDDKGRISASVMVGHDGHRGWLYYIATDPDSRGLDFGRQMVEAGEAWLRQRKVVKVQLLVRETNTEVISFYERIGFDVVPRTIMAKWLTNPTQDAH